MPKIKSILDIPLNNIIVFHRNEMFQLATSDNWCARQSLCFYWYIVVTIECVLLYCIQGYGGKYAVSYSTVSCILSRGIPAIVSGQLSTSCLRYNTGMSGHCTHTTAEILRGTFIFGGKKHIISSEQTLQLVWSIQFLNSKTAYISRQSIPEIQ